MRYPILSAIAALAAGCVSESVVELQNEAEWPLGYADGCETAEQRARLFSTRVVRDEDLFESSRAYAAAWRQGYLACGRTGTDIPSPDSQSGSVGQREQ